MYIMFLYFHVNFNHESTKSMYPCNFAYLPPSPLHHNGKGLQSPPSFFSVSKPHYLANVERIPPALQTLLELEFHAVERWAVERLRAAVWEVELALSQTSYQPCKTDGQLTGPRMPLDLYCAS